MLLEAYHVTDQGVAEGIRLMTAKGQRLACAKGCAACCVTHRSIPVYPLELVGITWYVTEKVEGEVRGRLMHQLAVHRHGQACAFLVDQVCSIHPLRPMACRQFNVFNTVCAEGEDAYYTRRGDVMTPLKKYTHQAFVGTMPFYGIKTRARAREVVQSGMQHQLVKDLQNIDWRHLADKMKDYDRLR